MKTKTLLAHVMLLCALAATGCGPARLAVGTTQRLDVRLLYPSDKTTIEMGQVLKSIVDVRDEQGMSVKDARVELTVTDPAGNDMGIVPAAFGDGDVYRSEGWTIPHKSQEGTWELAVQASRAGAEGTVTVPFNVRRSTSEVLLQKYGFWLDAPRLKGIEPGLFKEQGNAANGVILWGGLLPSQHIFTENWVEVQWRTGEFKLATEDQVRTFMLDVLGNIGFTAIRALGPFEQVRFKQWDAWQVKARGTLAQYDEQWMIFYAPEVGKTYAIGTTVALPPGGIDPHAALRDGFEVHPEVHADGVAPEPLSQLLPASELTGPALGTRLFGTGSPIVLRWNPVQALAPDEYYQVRVDYNYEETNTILDFATRATEFVLPDRLYNIPNCGVFNWQITLMRKTGTDLQGKPTGVPLSYNSLYWYVEWMHPMGEEAPFPPLCPNPQT